MQWRFASWGAAWISVFGTLLPTPTVCAQDVAPASPPATAAAAEPAVLDISLQQGGILSGVVVDGQGAPMIEKEVTVLQSGKVVARTTSNAKGEFAVRGLRGGVYQVIAGQGGTTLRAWEGNAAPPAAKPGAMIVGSGSVVRGQRPFGSLVFSDAIVLAAIIAAAIAIPIAISRSGKSQPSSS
ncbi:MAG TPA: carboxypeptidase-like regulatory domain-containing protein [Pirellulales bacterium]|jgi:hypothetical protein|nr:carboxypeptidase-like regulatory domain-containing protein [Pirellulales bacterium]